MSLQAWAWLFLITYIGAMIFFGVRGMRRISGSDDFATARGGYNGLFLALALTATTASGATFLGIPGLGYQFGFPVLLYAVVYPLGVYFGVLICIRVVSRAGHELGSRSLPEFLGDRYQSEAMRVLMACFSLILLFYLAGQLVAGLVMFEQMLGLSGGWALLITTGVLLVYVTMGGAHADILTDGVQGGLMLALSVLIIAMFVMSAGHDNFGLMIDRLRTQDPTLVAATHASYPLFDSFWDIATVFVAHIPLGMLPHIGNKVWALRSGTNLNRFVVICTAFGVVLALMSLGGILARAVLGDVLLADQGGANQAIPALFVNLFPTWLAALLGVGMLAAIMSTADGLVISSSQVFANDIYRRTLQKRLHPDATPEETDRRVLRISRWSTALVLIGSAVLAWFLLHMNIALLVWIGLGGMMAATAGPLLLGQIWRGATKAGAIGGFVAGAAVFTVLKTGVIPEWPEPNSGIGLVVSWLLEQQPNPFACAALGELASVVVTIIVSLFSKPLPQHHIERIFGGAGHE